MKTILVLCLLCTTAYAFPATSEEDSNESEFFRPLNKKRVPSVVEVDGSDSDEDSFFFPSFFRPILVNPFPQFNFGGFSNLFPSSMFRWGSLFNMFGRVPEDAKVTNATSTVKVIDGQRVTVNVTTYEKDGAIFKYEVVEVVRDKPEGEVDAESEKPAVINSEETTTSKTESEETSSPKNDNNSLDNEIFREEFDQSNWEHSGRRMQQTYSNYDRLPINFIDLSSDIRVNDFAEAAAVSSGTFAPPPDVEVFNVPRPIQRYYMEPPNCGHHYSHQFSENKYNYNYRPNEISRVINANNLQYYNPQPRNNLYHQQFLPPKSYNYQHRFRTLF